MPNIARLKLLREKLTTSQVNYFDITALGQTRAYDPDLQEWWLVVTVRIIVYVV